MATMKPFAKINDNSSTTHAQTHTESRALLSMTTMTLLPVGVFVDNMMGSATDDDGWLLSVMMVVMAVMVCGVASGHEDALVFSVVVHIKCLFVVVVVATANGTISCHGNMDICSVRAHSIGTIGENDDLLSH